LTCIRLQVLFGSYPIASCRQPYAVVRYLAAASWPRLQHKLALAKPGEQHHHQQQQQQQRDACDVEGQRQQLEVEVHQVQQQQQQSLKARDVGSTGQIPAAPSSSSSGDEVLQGGSDGWSPWMLCEALAEKRHWVLPRCGRLDTYR
jgi:hypothetical protein